MFVNLYFISIRIIISLTKPVQYDRNIIEIANRMIE